MSECKSFTSNFFFINTTEKYTFNPKEMNHFIVFVSVIYTCFRLSEGGGFGFWNCEKNTLEFRNELEPRIILKVNCTSKDNTIGVHDVLFNTSYHFRFGEHRTSRTIWRCLLRHPDPDTGYKLFHDLWPAYRGANKRRCGQRRLWIATRRGIYLEKNKEPRKFVDRWFH